MEELEERDYRKRRRRSLRNLRRQSQTLLAPPLLEIDCSDSTSSRPTDIEYDQQDTGENNFVGLTSGSTSIVSENDVYGSAWLNTPDQPAVTTNKYKRRRSSRRVSFGILSAAESLENLHLRSPVPPSRLSIELARVPDTESPSKVSSARLQDSTPPSFSLSSVADLSVGADDGNSLDSSFLALENLHPKSEDQVNQLSVHSLEIVSPSLDSLKVDGSSPPSLIIPVGSQLDSWKEVLSRDLNANENSNRTCRSDLISSQTVSDSELGMGSLPYSPSQPCCEVFSPPYSPFVPDRWPACIDASSEGRTRQMSPSYCDSPCERLYSNRNTPELHQVSNYSRFLTQCKTWVAEKFSSIVGKTQDHANKDVKFCHDELELVSNNAQTRDEQMECNGDGDDIESTELVLGKGLAQDPVKFEKNTVSDLNKRTECFVYDKSKMENSLLSACSEKAIGNGSCLQGEVEMGNLYSDKVFTENHVLSPIKNNMCDTLDQNRTEKKLEFRPVRNIDKCFLSGPSSSEHGYSHESNPVTPKNCPLSISVQRNIHCVSDLDVNDSCIYSNTSSPNKQQGADILPRGFVTSDHADMDHVDVTKFQDNDDFQFAPNSTSDYVLHIDEEVFDYIRDVVKADIPIEKGMKRKRGRLPGSTKQKGRKNTSWVTSRKQFNNHDNVGFNVLLEEGTGSTNLDLPCESTDKVETNNSAGKTDQSECFANITDLDLSLVEPCRKRRRKSDDFFFVKNGSSTFHTEEEACYDNSSSGRRSTRIRRKSFEGVTNKTCASKSGEVSCNLITVENSVSQQLKTGCIETVAAYEMENEQKVEDNRTQPSKNRPLMGMQAKSSKKRKKVETDEAIEALYRNKNFQAPQERTWETIFESPVKTKNPDQLLSQRRYKRSLCFESVGPLKLRRRIQKAARNGWDIKKHKKRALADAIVIDKLAALHAELGSNLYD